MDKELEKKLKEIEKVVVNAGIGRRSQEANFESKVLPDIENSLAMITGQKPLRCGAKKSIAGFKIREGNIIGLKVTLRGKRKNDFILKIINLVLPRVKDFRGIKTSSIDNWCNLNLGFKDQAVFPEVVLEKTNFLFGLQVTFVPRKPFLKKEDALEFYKSIGIPFKVN
jgi:large subunit ribosomal protein L5